MFEGMMEQGRRSRAGRSARVLLIGLFLAAAACSPAGRSSGGVAAVPIGPSDTAETLRLKAASVRPSARQLAWQAREFEAFVHFGMNTFTDREWGTGREAPALFQPTAFDPDQWMAAFKAAGVKCVILTAKHHDGFCLWPSRYTDHSVARSPWLGGKGDVVRAVSEACRRAGLKFGVYLSPWDRHEKTYGDSARYNEYYENQLRELLTGYGEISEVWFDGACGEGPNGRCQVYDWPGYWRVVRACQPNAVISIMGPDVRWVGNEGGQGRPSEWSVVPVTGTGDMPDEKRPGGIAGLIAETADLGSLEAIKAAARTGGRLIWYPAQTDVSIRPGWFSHPAENDKVKPLDVLLDIWYSSVGANTQLLLNVPPDATGLLADEDVRRLGEFGAALNRIFGRNLAAGARAAAAGSSTRGHGPELVLDGDPATFWQPDGERREYRLELALPAAAVFDTVMFRENIGLGQAIESFIVEARSPEGVWRELARATTVGNKRLLEFARTTADRIRLRITASRAVPAVSEFGLYLRRP